MKQKIDLWAKKLSVPPSFLILFFVLGLLVTWVSFYPKDKSLPAESSSASIDTYIPKGFVLVPLDLSNIESLNSFIGDAGVVDLYKSKNGEKGKKIATRVKIIRAPLNPQLFAALVPENKSSDLLNYNEAFFAVVQNKTESSGDIQAQKVIQQRHVIYQN